MAPATPYLPPNVYTTTQFQAPNTAVALPSRLPVFIGTGNETLSTTGFPIVRGSSSTSDIQVFEEDETGQAVVATNPDGSLVLGAWDGVSVDKFQVRNFPITTGTGRGVIASSNAPVVVTVDGTPTVVLSVNGTTGVVQIAATPSPTSIVRCTYYFDRNDTLVTDDVSAQVTPLAATLRSSYGGTYAFTTTSNVLQISVDGSAQTNITLPSVSSTAAAVAAAINAAQLKSLTATTFVNNLGLTALLLTANQSIVIGAGSANPILGFTFNQATSRNATFRVFNGPIVDGSNGGITTTDPANVVVTINGLAVAASSVNGTTSTVTLPYPPTAGSIVKIQYYFNTWQDTFDYLPAINVKSIDQASLTPSSASTASTFINGVSYVLKNDFIVWGAAALVSAGTHTSGAPTFGPIQVSASLVDNQAFLAPCTPVAGAVGPNPNTVWQLPYQPTTGNGRGNPLGTSLYLTVANGRLNLPTGQPALVTAYVGYSAQDALNKGAVTVLKVDSSTSQITLASQVPVGANVYASFYYNTLVDEAPEISPTGGYVLTSKIAGPGGTGTYTITRGSSSAPIYGVGLSGKGSDLSTITLQFPSGSEFFPDARIEGGVPIEENVTVQFASTVETPGRYTFQTPGPYYFVTADSDHLRVTLDGAADNTGTATGISLSSPTGGARNGFFASLIGKEVQYTAGSGETTYVITTGLNDVVSLNVDGETITATAGAATGTLANYVTAINTAALATPAKYTAAGVFSAYTVALNKYDQLTLNYTGSTTGSSGAVQITLAPGPYASVSALVAQINTQLAAVNGAGVGHLLGSVTCYANVAGQLQFAITTLGAADTSGYLEFLNNATAARDFAIIAGIDTDAATLGNQTKLYQGNIAFRYTVSTVSGKLPYDRLILRNRIMPGGASVSYAVGLGQSGITVLGASGNSNVGLVTGEVGVAGVGAVVQPPSIAGVVGWGGGIASGNGDARDGQPDVIFYDGSNPANPANNVFTFSVNGSLVTVNFTGSGSGTATALGPVGLAGSVLGVISAAITASGISGLSVIQEGSGLRIVGGGLTSTASLVIGNGSANSILGFTNGESATSVPVSVRETASALMAQAQASGSSSAYVLNQAAASGYFAARALAKAIPDVNGVDYLYIQSQTVTTSASTSSVQVDNASTADALTSGTGLVGVLATAFTGDSALNGFYVTSSDPVNGSGSSNTSILHSGSGQDGVVGQSYRDSKTGLTFTVLPRGGGLTYPTTGAAHFTLKVSKTFLANGNVPSLAIPGVQLTVTDTNGVTTGDTALVETFTDGGSQPAVGQTYYVNITYEKPSFAAQIFTKDSDVYAAFGNPSPGSPISLAAYLAFRNGCTVFGIQQVQRDTGSSTASLATYLTALDGLSGASLPGGISPSVLVPLTPASSGLLSNLALHCDIQSSARYQAERTAIVGCASGTLPKAVRAFARATGSTRIRIAYPDVANLTITDSITNVSTQYLVDGTFLAAALAAATVSANTDPATPWEGLKIVGFDSLGRILDNITMNQIAGDGVTILTQSGGAASLSVRHGLTTDMTSDLTKLPTVIQISDYVQILTRNVLQPFVGVKYLPAILTQIEGRLNQMFADLVAAQIITSYTGISVTPDPNDPTGAVVSAWYVPVFPLLYLSVTYRLSSQVSA